MVPKIAWKLSEWENRDDGAAYVVGTERMTDAEFEVWRDEQPPDGVILLVWVHELDEDAARRTGL